MTAPLLGRFLASALSKTMARCGNLPARRAAVRCPFAGRVVVVMHDANGRERSVAGRGVEMSAGGAMIEAACPVEPGTLAWIDFESPRLTAIAHARHCSRSGLSYRIGFQFSAPPMPVGGSGIHLVYRATGARR